MVMELGDVRAIDSEGRSANNYLNFVVNVSGESFGRAARWQGDDHWSTILLDDDLARELESEGPGMMTRESPIGGFACWAAVLGFSRSARPEVLSEYKKGGAVNANCELLGTDDDRDG
jgi:hypothetical protein